MKNAFRETVVPIVLIAIMLFTLLALASGSPVPAKTIPSESRVRFGVAAAPQYFTQRQYPETIRQTFDSLTPETALKFGLIHPCPPPALTDPTNERYHPGVAEWVNSDATDRCDGTAASEWDWTPMDQLVRWARRHDIAVYGHTLLWHTQNPAWLTESNLSPTQLEWLMTRHIEAVVSRYCHDIYAWDVVNEGVAPDGRLLELGPWHRVPDYIDKAFRAARTTLERCHSHPDQVSLFYNDFEIEYSRALPYETFVDPPGRYNKTEAVYNYLASLLNRADPTPIDGIGLQAHLRLGDEPSEAHEHNMDALIGVMRRFAALGLEVKITEMDVPLYSLTPSAYYDEQASLFSEVAMACRRVRQCTGFTVWGLRDSDSWRGEAAAPLLFSHETCGDTYCGKPALFALQKVLRQPRK